MVEVQIEFSYAKLESVELTPLTPRDFRKVEENGDYLEENLLNQMQVFYPN